jgi:hypothetical protein
MVAPEPAALAAFFAALQGKESVHHEDGALRISTARGRITVVTPAAFAARFGRPSAGPDTPHFAASRISGVDPAAEAARLAAAGIPHRSAGDALQVPAAAAFGVAVEFAL